MQLPDAFCTAEPQLPEWHGRKQGTARSKGSNHQEATYPHSSEQHLELLDSISEESFVWDL